jgi:hypothetical protein
MQVTLPKLKNIAEIVKKNFFFFWFFKTGFFRVALAVWLSWNSVDQAGLELRNPPASASQVLGLKAFATTARGKMFLMYLRNRPFSIHVDVFCFCFCFFKTSKDDLLLTDFEGALKFFRVQLPKRYRSEENAKRLMELACNTKVQQRLL